MLKKALIWIAFIAIMFSIPEIISAVGSQPSVTYDKVVKMTQQANTEIEQFIQNPSTNTIDKTDFAISTARSAFSELTLHQTFWTRILRVKPVLTKDQRNHIKQMNKELDDNIERYVQTIARDIHEAEEIGFYKVPETLYISLNASDEPTRLMVKGEVDVRDNTIFQRHYFLIRTPGKNYIIKRPANYSMSVSDRKATFRFEKKQYIIESNILH